MPDVFQLELALCAARQPGEDVEHPFDLYFSQDSRHLIGIYSGKNGSRYFLTIDGQAGDYYTRILPNESPNSAERFPFLFFDAPDRFHFFAIKDGMIERVEMMIPAR